MDSYSSEEDEYEFNLWQAFKKLSVSALEAIVSDTEDPTGMIAVTQLHLRGNESSFQLAIDLTKKSTPELRARGARILAQLGTPAFPYKDRSVPLLTALLLEDSSSYVQSEAVSALGHLKAEGAVAALSHAAASSDVDLRISVAVALGSTSQGDHPPQALLHLTHDPIASVRSWAALALGTREGAGQIEKARLTEMLTDPEPEVSEEAQDSLMLLASKGI